MKTIKGKKYAPGAHRRFAFVRSPKVGNPIASILESKAKGMPALFDLNPVSNLLGFTKGLCVYGFRYVGCGGFRVYRAGDCS